MLGVGVVLQGCQLIQPTRGHCRQTAGKLVCLEDTGDIIDDVQLLDALRHQFPWAKTGAGWRISLLNSCEPNEVLQV